MFSHVFLGTEDIERAKALLILKGAVFTLVKLVCWA
ncbi:hypothetical protein FB443_1011245 [Vibrio crassostreae]|nr:hypothetical protein FB443_1011245 [Vibrio crassostreae]